MKRSSIAVGFILLFASVWFHAQVSSQMPVPPLVNFSGVLTDVNGKPLTSITGVTFLLYNEEQGGAPLWMETQNVQPDSTGHYSVMLGSTTSAGLPSNLFVAGEARWLGIQPQGQAEQPRVMLLSVPYAIKAVDAQTVGGLPPSAFVLAAPITSASTAPPSTGAQPLATGTIPVTTAGGTGNSVAKFDASADITNSQIFDNGTNVGIGTITPATKLDVKGAGTIRGQLSILGTLLLPATGAATATAGKNSQPLNLAASAFSSGTSKAVNQTFQWQAEPAANNTSSPSGTLNLLFGSGTSKPTETGLNIASNGLITFAAGQTFPGTGTGNGSVTSVATGLGLTGGPITTSGTLAIDTTVVPQLNVANVFTGNQTVNGNLSATGTVTGRSFQIGSNLFAVGSYSNQNAYLGFSGSSTWVGTLQDTALGYQALAADTTGSQNVAVGGNALTANTTGSWNTASGFHSLLANTTGNYNTGVGMYALQNNLTASNNIAIGYYAAANVSDGFSNIHIGSGGAPTDHNTIRIGTPLAQTSFFVAGVNGVMTGNNDAVPVMIDSNGQLGTIRLLAAIQGRYRRHGRRQQRAAAAPPRHLPLQTTLRRRLQTNRVRPDCRRGRRSLSRPGRPFCGWTDRDREVSIARFDAAE